MFTEEYLSEEAKEKLTEMEDDDDEDDFHDECIEVKSKLTDEDLNQLI